MLRLLFVCPVASLMVDGGQSTAHAMCRREGVMSIARPLRCTSRFSMSRRLSRLQKTRPTFFFSCHSLKTISISRTHK